MMKKIKGIKKAVGEFNHWYGNAQIMYDPTDNTVWCDIFTDCNWCNDYQNKAIKCIASKGYCGCIDIDNTTTMKQIEKTIREEF